MKQRTIARTIEIVGIGLHKGVPVKMKLEPLDSDMGIIFYRVDAGVTIPLKKEFVSLIFIFNVKMGIEAGLGVSVLSVAFSVFILLLDVLVSFIQAYVFTLLSALYFGMASPEHH